MKKIDVVGSLTCVCLEQVGAQVVVSFEGLSYTATDFSPLIYCKCRQGRHLTSLLNTIILVKAQYYF